MTGVGEANVAGDWDADDLPAAIEALLRTADARRHGRAGRVATRQRDLGPRLPRRITMALAGRHVRYHYDLGNDLYRLFLDDSLTYSCALFTEPGMTLEEAQRAKHRAICDKPRLGPDDHVLEIGCGWGAFAAVAAGEYGARVTGPTLSHEQHAEATARMRAVGLEDRVRILLQDHRTMTGRFTPIASTEMIEAIGHRELPIFFGACDGCSDRTACCSSRSSRCRTSGTTATCAAATGSASTCSRARPARRLGAMVDAMRRSSDLVVHDTEDIGIHYAETLRRWRVRFEDNLEAVRALGFDEAFVRAWWFYLASCEGAFRARSITDLSSC